MSATTNQLLVRNHKFVRVFFTVCAVLFLVFAIATVTLAMANVDGSFPEPIAVAVLFGGFWATASILCVGVLVMTWRHCWRLDSRGIEVVGVIRHRRIPWEEVSRLRIESYGEWPCYKMTLCLQDGAVRMCDWVEFTRTESDDPRPDHNAILAVAPDKIELTEGPGFRTYATKLAYWFLFVFVLCLVVDMVYKHFIAP